MLNVKQFNELVGQIVYYYVRTISLSSQIVFFFFFIFVLKFQISEQDKWKEMEGWLVGF